MTAGPAVVDKGSAVYIHLLHSRPWYRNTRLILAPHRSISAYTYGYDASMMNGLQSLTQWNQAFDYPAGGKLGLLAAIQNIGALSAYPFAPYMADGMGRRFSIIFGASVMIAATVIQTASNSCADVHWSPTFAATAAPLLIAEVAYPSHRAKATSLYNPLWQAVLVPWEYCRGMECELLPFATLKQEIKVIVREDLWHLRYPDQLGVENSFCAPRGFICDTSLVDLVCPRVSTVAREQGKSCMLNPSLREEHALQVLAYYHASGNTQDPLVQYEFEEIKAAIAFDREVAGNVGWLSLIKTPGNRKRMRIIIALAVFSEWSGNDLNKVFTAIGITDQTTQLLFNGLLNTYNFIVTTIACFYCERVGRRPLFLVSCAGMTRLLDRADDLLLHPRDEA
ncbi:hypothetical protein EDB19DRAFT_1908933 [Suillus lakei]|nr:hypothetical protein EDB19DRAFT_1908933 [Suillus lakei]